MTENTNNALDSTLTNMQRSNDAFRRSNDAHLSSFRSLSFSIIALSLTICILLAQAFWHGMRLNSLEEAVCQTQEP